MSYAVTAPLVIVRDAAGAMQYHYQGAVLPDYVSSDDLKRLADEGLIIRTEVPADAPVLPIDQRPTKNASLEAWSEYAITQGATVEELDGLSRDEIRSLYPQV